MLTMEVSPLRKVAGLIGSLAQPRPCFSPLFTEVPGETVWKIAEGTLDSACAMAQDCKMVLLYPLLPIGGDPNWGLSRFSKQFRKVNSRNFACSEFSEVRPQELGHMLHISALLPSLCCTRYMAG
jgi:hypothetical protein